MRVVQKAIIKENDKFLILLRSENEDVYPNYWDLPGGKPDEGEDPITAIKREVLEETNLKIKVLETIGEFVMENYHEDKIIRKFILYIAEIISGEIKLSEEHNDYKWISKEDISKLKTEPFLRDHVKI